MAETKRTAKGQFLPGQSGNPGGRPRGGSQYCEVSKTALTLAKWRKIVNKAIADAIEGDRYARAFLADCVVGKPIETLPKEELSDELQRDLDKVYGDGSEGGLSEGSD